MSQQTSTTREREKEPWTWDRLAPLIVHRDPNPLDATVIVFIVASAVLVGFETDPDISATYRVLFHNLNLILIAFFGLEIVIRMASYRNRGVLAKREAYRKLHELRINTAEAEVQECKDRVEKTVQQIERLLHDKKKTERDVTTELNALDAQLVERQHELDSAQRAYDAAKRRKSDEKSYWTEWFNLFDLAIFILTVLPYLLNHPDTDLEAAMALRSVRLFESLRALRLLHLTTELKDLRSVIVTLVNSLPKIAMVALLLFLMMYAYAVTGTFMFSANDPMHFGDLPTSLLTMFQCATGNFGEVMDIAVYGSTYDTGYYENLTAHFDGVRPERFPILGPIFFISFVLLAALTILNFFIGIITTELDRTRKKEEDDSAELLAIGARVEAVHDKVDALLRTARTK